MLVAVDKEGACLRLMMLGSGGDREFPSKPKKWNGACGGAIFSNDIITHPNIAHFALLHCSL